ncbi:unnamed protein product, partial [Arabidopsis halleri]
SSIRSRGFHNHFPLQTTDQKPLKFLSLKPICFIIFHSHTIIISKNYLLKIDI